MHAPNDSQWVRSYLARGLADAGVTCRIQAELPAGMPVALGLDDAIASCRAQVLVVSRSTPGDFISDLLAALAVHRELDTKTWTLIPFVLDVQTFEQHRSLLKIHNAIVAEDDWEDGLRRLVRHFDRRLPDPPDPPKHPYLGLRPFSPEDRDVFFGRDAEVSELIPRIARRRLLVITGPSGCGKSSLVRAGVIPRLTADGPTRDRRTWLAHSIVPGVRPQDELWDALDPERSASSLSGAAGRLAADAHELLLFIDQVEGVLTADGYDAFFEALRELTAVEHVHVLIAVRDEFRSDLRRTAVGRLAETSEYTLQALDEQGMADAIVGPARRVGVTVDASLVERLVADAAGEPGILPFVQETMVALWPSVRRGYLPYEAYMRQRIGDEDRTATGLYAALGNHAEDVRAALDASDDLLRRVLIRLVQFGENRPNVRRRQSLGELVAGPPDVAEALRSLVVELAAEDQRLLTLSRRGDPGDSGTGPDDVLVSLAHDALLSHWRFLRTLATDPAAVEAERTRREVLRDAGRYAQLGRSYLWTGARLRAATRWARSHRDDVSVPIADFLRASRRRYVLSFAAAAALVVVVVSAVLPRWLSWRAERQAFEEARGDDGLVVAVIDVAVERFEVSNARYGACVRAGHCRAIRASAGGLTLDDPDGATLPVVNVSAYDAAAFCAWIGRRLPSWQEWLHVATGGGSRRWPWSGDAPPDPRRVNVYFVAGTSSPGEVPLSVRTAIDTLAETDRLTAGLLADLAPWVPDDEVQVTVEDWPIMGRAERRERLIQFYEAVGETADDHATDDLALLPVRSLRAGATPGERPIHHLLGNAGEWTTTTADCPGDVDQCTWNGVADVALWTASSVAGDAEALDEPLAAVASSTSETRGFRCAGP